VMVKGCPVLGSSRSLGSPPHPAVHQARLAAIHRIPVMGRAWRKEVERRNRAVATAETRPSVVRRSESVKG
jgi:hypothetical protein